MKMGYAEVDIMPAKPVIMIGFNRDDNVSILTSLRNLMETMGWSIEQAMDALKLPEEERELYIRKLKE